MTNEVNDTPSWRRRGYRPEVDDGSESASTIITEDARAADELWLWDSVRQKWYWWSEPHEAYVYEDGEVVWRNGETAIVHRVSTWSADEDHFGEDW